MLNFPLSSRNCWRFWGNDLLLGEKLPSLTILVRLTRIIFHTWASWHVQAGTPLFTLKELGGWETLEMVKKYAHLNADNLLEHANNIEFNGTFTAQSKSVTHLKLVA